MTLIVSHISKEYVIQVSDRRLTDLESGKSLDRETTKAVLFNSNFTFGYTGLANLRRSHKVMDQLKLAPGVIETHDWLVEVLRLNPQSLDNSIGAIFEEITQVASSFPRISQAFIGIGWVQLPGSEALVPIIIEVSNYEDPGRPRPDFRVFDFRLMGKERSFTHYSTIIPEKIKKLAKRVIRKAESDNCGPKEIAEILIRTVRQVSDVMPTVSKAVLATCLPKQQVERVVTGGDWTITTQPFNLDNFTFQYIPANEGTGMHYGPAFCVNGNHAAGLNIEGTGKLIVLNPGSSIT